MADPAKFGVIVYSRDISSLSQFYMDMFSMISQRETDDFISVGKDGLNLVIHTPPIDIPERNFNTVKLFITVDNLEEAKKRATELGGEALAGIWSNPIFRVCNIADPEGNHIQIREFAK